MPLTTVSSIHLTQRIRNRFLPSSHKTLPNARIHGSQRAVMGRRQIKNSQ
jgi:hypothetical protein